VSASELQLVHRLEKPAKDSQRTLRFEERELIEKIGKENNLDQNALDIPGRLRRKCTLLHIAYGAARLQPAKSVGPLALVP
jgi:hypothetical protein